MSRSWLLLSLLLLAPLGHSAPPTAPESPKIPAGFHQVKLNGHTFTLREGFSIELVAGPPLVERPIVAAFDEKGRLYVCDSSGSNEKVTEQVKKKPHRIVQLTDTDGDGRYDKSTVFVANVMFPEGAMWLDGSLYVAAPPQIMKFTDTDGDGKADKEEVWFDGKTLTGCANDLHGPYLGPDGWIYWCKGAFARQEYTLGKEKKFSTRAAHIFRAKPDGSRMEPVMTGGMDNPVDVVFTPGGERIFSTTFLQHPGNGKRDGLIHAIYGGVYGKDWDPVYEHPWTSPSLMPVLTHLGPAAPCGLHRYESDQFGKDYENNIFCCQFNMRKVSRHVLAPSGSTFTTKDSDFVASDNLDFHPTDVIEDADGSLLVIDTGGWYKLCCPTSQLVKPDVKGAIYRIKKVEGHKIADPRGQRIPWEKLNEVGLGRYLHDSRPAVQKRAMQEARTRDLRYGVTVAALAGNTTTQGILNAIWLADPDTNGGAGLKLITNWMHDPREEIRLAVLHVFSLYGPVWPYPREKIERLLLTDKSMAVRRVAAEALGRIGKRSSIPAIFYALAEEKNDRVLDHSLTYALIEIADPELSPWYGSPRVRRAALTALEAMPNGKLNAEMVFPKLDAEDSALRETAWWIAGRHPAWGNELVSYFGRQLNQADKLGLIDRFVLSDRLAKFAKNEAVRTALGSVLVESKSDATSQVILNAMNRSGLKVCPDVWVKGLGRSLKSKNPELVRLAIGVLRAVPVTRQQYTELGTSAELPKANDWGLELHMQFLAIEPPGIELNDTHFKAASPEFKRTKRLRFRSAAADLLARHDLSAEQLLTLADKLKTTAPAEVGKLLSAFARSTDAKVGKALVQGLSVPNVQSMIRVEMVKPILDKYPPAVREDAEKLYALLAEARKGERDKLERLLKTLPTGDIRRGQLVFNGSKGLCASCHKIGYVGGLVGPDLTRIGNIRNERDLLESIIFPSASFVRSYEPVKVTTMGGRTLNGILKKDGAGEIVLAIAADKEERISRSDVEEISPSSVSIMPAGFDQQLSVQEIADLLAFLKACR